jgi:hypothetical protein
MGKNMIQKDMPMEYYMDLMNNRPYVPERDMFRMLKYGTYNLLELYENDLMPWQEFTEEEFEIIDEFEVSRPEDDFMFDDLPDNKN